MLQFQRSANVHLHLAGANPKSNFIAGPIERKKKERLTNEEVAKSVPVFTKKEIATVAQHIEILDTMKKNGWSQSKAAKELGPQYPNLKLNQPLLSSWVKDETKWQAQYNDENTKGCAGSVKHVCQFEHPELEEMLELWVARAMIDGVSLTGEII